MTIIFSEHARHQLHERNLSTREVERVLLAPDKTVLEQNNRFRAVKKFRKGDKTYLLVVVYDEQNSIKEVVTAFFTSQLKKYL